MVGLVEHVKELLKEEFVGWLEENKENILNDLPPECKIYPLLCGSIVEGFITKGCDVDFAFLIDDEKKKPRLKNIRRAYKNFFNKVDQRLKNELGLKGLCGFSRSVRTTSWLYEFKRCKNPGFRVNYFLFGKLLKPKVNDRDINERIADKQDLLTLKKKLQKKYQKIFILLKVNEKVPKNITQYTPKTLYRHIQLIVNNFLMAYGLIEDKLTEKMEKELFEKSLRVVKSTLSKKAQNIILNDVKKAFNKIFELKKIKKQDTSLKGKRLRYLLNKGYLSEDDLKVIKRTLIYFTEYVYTPLRKFYKIHTKLFECLNHESIKWLGLRTDHAFISLQKLTPLKYIDIIYKESDDKFLIYAGLAKQVEEELLRKRIDVIFETEQPIGSLQLPCRTHQPTGKLTQRVHVKLMEIKMEDVNNLNKQKFFEALNKLLSKIKENKIKKIDHIA